jgi:hypothetical protein
VEESAAKRREPHEALMEVEELHMLDEDEVKHAELALEGLEEPAVSTVEAEKEDELTRIVGPEGSANKVRNEFCAAIERHWAPQVFRYVDLKPGYERLPFPFAQGNVTTVDANLEEFLEERVLKVASEATEVIFEEELPSEVATGAPIEEAETPEIAPEAL